MRVSDRRQHKRTTYYCEARIEGLDVARGACRLADISAGGAFVEARTVLPPGTRTRVRFELLGQQISALAEVRYCEPGIGMGIRFLDLSPPDRATIDRFLRERSATG
jgi:hypothetical protein